MRDEDRFKAQRNEAIERQDQRIKALEAELKQAKEDFDGYRDWALALIGNEKIPCENKIVDAYIRANIVCFIVSQKSVLARVTKERDEILAMLREVTFRGNFAPNDYELELRACEMIRVLDPDKKGGGA